MKRIGQLLTIVCIPVLLANTQHPAGMQSRWLNKSASELEEAYGKPDMILETAVRGFVIYGDKHSVMYIYTSDPEHQRGCIAAYVVEHDTELILRYQCREAKKAMADGTDVK